MKDMFGHDLSVGDTVTWAWKLSNGDYRTWTVVGVIRAMHIQRDMSETVAVQWGESVEIAPISLTHARTNGRIGDIVKVDTPDCTLLMLKT